MDCDMNTVMAGLRDVKIRLQAGARLHLVQGQASMGATWSWSRSTDGARLCLAQFDLANKKFASGVSERHQL
eukprot:3472856-Pleurochrysis_carterae.AAC.2